MIEHIWTLICSNAIVDRDTNNVSIFNILEQVTIPKNAINNQVIAVGIELITLWVRSDLSKPAKGKSQINLVAPNGEVTKSVDSEIDLSKFERLRSRVFFQGLPYNGEGIYRFIVLYKVDDEKDWEQVASIPLKMVVSPREEQARSRTNSRKPSLIETGSIKQ